MKTTHKLASAALLAAVGVGLAMPSATKAAPEQKGKGNIEFQTDLTTNPTNLPPGESSGDELTEPTQNPDPSALKIVSVTDMDFDKHDIIANDSEKTYKALPFTDGTQTTAHFVRFRDVRANVAENFYSISVALTKQFTSTGAVASELTGSKLTYNNVSLVTGTNSATLPTSAAVKAVSDLEFAEDGSKAQTMLTNDQKGKGFGVFELMFDTNENAKAGKDTYDGVTLKVPGDNVLKEAKYEAEITWAITAAP
ncbi:hypothetical protein UAY_00065 [Enterococcus moraviensis ATCC BAA-383]|uniref:WxL domain-containing protein n=1 Tax=Enterococcus moraviensis ATCC BAA-383 TaxID=1158609 RepID=R2THR4_9ENTE|nr:WxL domain-containing protein [Enterococcus moraviensis]EOI06723.1 hypothetical protein UAY_00065 [Enterococcus moraviensis ATCC BAA-383]EOT65060.1 hypothetical protein I586_02794 [Enterococcus moraviensis ATCC BAA-383]OJG66907.1 hypothetical protein RV09_GL003124 [Enterococcus moraviensis]